MIVIPIYHSGFLVETAYAYFLFDWWKGKLPAAVLSHKKAAGSISENPWKPLYVFASHSHSDHYNPEIFNLDADAFILSWEMEPLVRDEIKKSRPVFFLRPHKTLDLGDGKHLPQSVDPVTSQPVGLTSDSESVMQTKAEKSSESPASAIVYTLASNDLGIAFAVSTPDGNIYHAGDLNNWWWDGDSEDQGMERFYHRELQKIEGTHFRAAMIPYDLRLKEPGYGIRDFLQYCSADAIYPMHFNAERSRASAAFQHDPVMKGVQNVHF